MNKTLPVHQFEFNLWANLALIEICSGLTTEQLTMTQEGVAGDISYILGHIVHGEGVYIRHITGALPWPSAYDVYAQPVSELASLAAQTGKRLIELCESVDLDASHDFYDAEDGGTYTITKWTVLLQALYHGVEHRTHLKILLTKLGVPHPELCGWSYSEEAGGGTTFVPTPQK